MWAQLLMWAIVVCGLLLLLKQWVAWLSRRHDQPRTVYFLVVTENAERDIEGVLRRLAHKCRNLDEPSQLWVIDAGSNDLTLPIVERFGKKNMSVEIHHAASYEQALGLASHVRQNAQADCFIYELRDSDALDRTAR